MTIWRWGRRSPLVKRGAEFGSYNQWTRWVRDPLLALGVPDPVRRIAAARDKDPVRQAKIDQVNAIPGNPKVEPADGGDPGCEYFKVQLDNINGSHVYGQRQATVVDKVLRHSVIDISVHKSVAGARAGGRVRQ